MAFNEACEWVCEGKGVSTSDDEGFLCLSAIARVDAEAGERVAELEGQLLVSPYTPPYASANRLTNPSLRKPVLSF